MVAAEVVAKEISSKLRGYEGLTPDKLAQSPTLLEALGTSDPHDAYWRLKMLIEGLPQDRYMLALHNALRLNESAAESLTGSNGRRSVFGRMNNVSEETVKSWESRAIETLSQVITAGRETLQSLAVVFFLDEKHRIMHKAENKSYLQPDGQNLRVETRNFSNESTYTRIRWEVLVQMVDELPQDLDIYAVFPTGTEPKFVVPVAYTDIFGYVTDDFQISIHLQPQPARELLGDESLDEPERSAFDRLTAYQFEFGVPKPGRIYGMKFVWE